MKSLRQSLHKQDLLGLGIMVILFVVFYFLFDEEILDDYWETNVILILINILLLIVGCFMDTTPAMMVLSPILLPVATSLGLSPIHFGIIMVVNLAIGFITPPLGINLFVAARIGDVKLEVVCQGIIRFIIAMIVCLLAITFIPAISEFLPRLSGML